MPQRRTSLSAAPDWGKSLDTCDSQTARANSQTKTVGFHKRFRLGSLQHQSGLFCDFCRVPFGTFQTWPASETHGRHGDCLHSHSTPQQFPCTATSETFLYNQGFITCIYLIRGVCRRKVASQNRKQANLMNTVAWLLLHFSLRKWGAPDQARGAKGPAAGVRDAVGGSHSHLCKPWLIPQITDSREQSPMNWVGLTQTSMLRSTERLLGCKQQGSIKGKT